MNARCLLLVVLITATTTTTTSADDSPPNVVVIYCDDLGYADIGCFGSAKHRTPNIDRLAEAGRKFTSFYVTSGVCTPSRSSLMTGCYPRRVNMHVNARNEQVLFPIAQRGLNPQETTIAEVLKSAGYATACVGKWHLGDQPEFLPTEQGFDEYFGIPYSNDMGVRQRRPQKNPPLPLLRNTQVIEAPADQNTLTKRYTEEAVRFITRNANRGQSFFLYMPHTMPHNPVHSSAAFRGKSANGGFGDCVEEIDWSVGQITTALRKLDLERNTLVIFTSDNGASNRWGGSNGPLRGYKASTWEGGMRVCCVMRWPARIPAGTTCNMLCSTIDLLPTLANLAGQELDTSRTIDGHDILPLLTGIADATSPHEAFFYYRRDQLQAVRAGRWKLFVHPPDVPRSKTVVRLYDLVKDLGETTDVSKEHPDVVAELMRHIERARKELGDETQQGSGQRPAGHVDNPQPLTMTIGGAE